MEEKVRGLKLEIWRFAIEEVNLDADHLWTKRSHPGCCGADGESVRRLLDYL